MKNFPEFQCGLFRVRRLPGICLACLIVLLGLASSRVASGQATESATADHDLLWAGAGGSYYTLGYGDRKLVGLTGWVDYDTVRRYGIEAEGRWLDWQQTANVHDETFLLGPRYHMNYGRLQIYAKGLVGFGKFNFPYNYATGNYFVIAPGGGVDYRLSRRWSVRSDFEYQIWPQFTFGSMSSAGITVGLRRKIL